MSNKPNDDGLIMSNKPNDDGLITDGVIPIDLSDLLETSYNQRDATQDATSGAALSPVITVAELVGQPSPPITVAQATPLKVAQIICVTCGGPIPDGAVFCPACKHREADAARGVAARSNTSDAAASANAQTGPRPYFDDLLKKVPWLTTGGSLLGWSKLKAAKHCLQHFFWEYVMGVEPRPYVSSDDDGKPHISPLHLGSLVHGAIEGFYRTGGVAGMEQVYAAVSGHYPEVVLEARRLVGFYFTLFNASEQQQWDLRTVERESRYYYPARMCAGKRRSLGISSRIDGAYRLLQPGYPRLPPGQPSKDGVRIHEIKTTAYLDWDRLRGFYMDAQLNLQLLTWNHGHAIRRTHAVMGDGSHVPSTEVLRASNAELVGPAAIVTVTHIGKAKRQDPSKDIDRSHYMIPDERVMQFAAEIGDWLYEEIGERLFHRLWDQPDTWRRDWVCKDYVWGKHGNCPYISICQAGEVDETAYSRRADRGLRPVDIELPKSLARASRPRRKAAADVTGK